LLYVSNSENSVLVIDLVAFYEFYNSF
jgi:hypothetical protein